MILKHPVVLLLAGLLSALPRMLFAAILLLNAPACTADVSVDARPPALQQRIDAALIAKGAAYRPRTEHLLPNGQPRYTNRLILEDSLYLLQHAHNPVDWYPWGKEAFAKARRENKLIFLSIGYSTCHWCHVMEKESFENPAIARQLNRHFVAIKVDRESRPDLDHLYMTAVNLLSGHGGWPMNSLLTPDGHTVQGGTYYRPDDLSRLLTQAEQLWREQPGTLKAQSAAVARAVNQAMAREAAMAELPPTLAVTTTRRLLEHHDALQGGFGTAPKFPNEPLLALLLDQAVRVHDRAARTALTTDLDAMAAGGIHDQAGGGFYRYSTDSEWLVPHFEKMLYTQAQLARLYVAAGHGQGEYARVTRRALDFVLREMRAPDGGFYSALDADSAGGEGRHDLWTPATVRAALGPSDAAFTIQQYGITASGNFEGASILHLSKPLGGTARARLDRIDAALLKARQLRPRPPRDDKILTGWNGLMITALAEAGERLDEPRYLAAARRAAEFLWQHHRRADGSLWRVSLHGRAGTAGIRLSGRSADRTLRRDRRSGLARPCPTVGRRHAVALSRPERRRLFPCRG
ncbi:MAG: thioredoxin domain-containing protein [Thiobacillus sp.]|nr:thioredoxin domain-containing protein [Thiobacillus sp.]